MAAQTAIERTRREIVLKIIAGVSDASLPFGGPRRNLASAVHGTGCALSTAIAAYLARGRTLLDACSAAKAFVAERLAAPVSSGRGAGAVL